MLQGGEDGVSDRGENIGHGIRAGRSWVSYSFITASVTVAITGMNARSSAGTPGHDLCLSADSVP